MNKAEQGEEPGPGATPLLHGVGVAGAVVLQAGVQRAHTVALLVERAGGAVAGGWHQVPVLCVEQEDKAQQDRQQALVEVA